MGDQGMQVTRKHVDDYMQLKMAYQGMQASYQMEKWVHGLPATVAQSWPEELPEFAGESPPWMEAQSANMCSRQPTSGLDLEPMRCKKSKQMMQICRGNIHECKQSNSEPNGGLGNETRRRKVGPTVC